MIWKSAKSTVSRSMWATPGTLRAFSVFCAPFPSCWTSLKDVQRYCPNAVFLNYTNPMAMLCRAMQEAAPEVLTTGLCHSVQHGIEKFSKILNIPVNEIEYTCAGINHLAYLSEADPQRRKPVPGPAAASR